MGYDRYCEIIVFFASGEALVDTPGYREKTMQEPRKGSYPKDKMARELLGILVSHSNGIEKGTSKLYPLVLPVLSM